MLSEKFIKENAWSKKYRKARRAWNDVFQDYRLVFGNVFDRELSLALKEPKISVIKFDNIIHTIYGDYPRQSLNSFVLEKFGKEALAIFTELTEW